MAAPPPPPSKGGGLSLYDNLHDPNDPSPDSTTISSAPVRYNQAQGDEASSESTKKTVNSAFLFQPTIRRPQAKQARPKATFPKTIPNPQSTTSTNKTQTSPTASQVQPQKSTLAAWTATEEDEWRYATGEKHQRGGKKKKKRKQEVVETDWDDIYDPSRPTDVEEYLKSDEKIAEVREWKSVLYKHRQREEPEDSDFSSDYDDDDKPTMSNRFAPPASFDFAPPPVSPPPNPPPPADVPKDESGDDAFARRQTLSQNQLPPSSPPQVPSTMDTTTISAAPIRYNQAEPSPSPPLAEDDASEDPTPRSSRPGQAGFAQRLMSKYGWTAGSGLGAESSGILNPLHVQVEKRRKKADADGGGWAEPGGKGKIFGGKRKDDGPSKFGTMSEVIVLQNMLEDMPDLQHEISEGLGQEIGEECGEKYGRVERLYIDQENRQVFIKFTDQVSALRAVNELDGRVFNGNTIIPKFYDLEKFERGAYK